MADPQLLKEITIKTGVVKRLLKEISYYKKESEGEAAKLEKMKADSNADEYMVKKQAEIVQLLDANSTSLDGSKEYTAACEQIQAVSSVD
ncbi:unnamed protein product [Anisakis simplex]|uniref:Tubulin-specific chaperone A n=1 Tax=Anisakis simplex TaxID=6269 RepID=A0A0M3JZ99_ANISI|nr:unnamed protein product [Anisakis simplex]